MRWVWAIGWMAAALLATAAMGMAGAVPGRWPEEMHLLGHIVLCGGCSAAVAFASTGSDTRRATVGLVAGLLLGAAIEVVQMGWQPNWEVVHDLGIDLPRPRP